MGDPAQAHDIGEQEGTEIFRALHRAADAACGARLFTVTVLDRDAGLARRAYSSHPVEYPVSGTKPMRNDAWTVRVIDGGKSFVANTTAQFAPYFKDHALINALGCASALNIPVSDGERVIGTINILDAENHFDDDRVGHLEDLVGEHRSQVVAAMKAMR